MSNERRTTQRDGRYPAYMSRSVDKKPSWSTLGRVLSCGVVLCGPTMVAEAGAIRGTVSEQTTLITLEGAEVSLIGAERVTTTARGGSFRFDNVPPGEYSLRVSYVGAEPVVRPVTVAGTEAVLELAIIMNLGTVFELETLEVVGSEIGQAKALSQRKSAANLMEVVAADAFGQFVDRNAAEALQRVAGISVEDSQGEGKFIIVRGADPSLNSISIDGVIAATPEEDGRQTGLNIISIDQLERIEVEKTWLPSEWAHFVGGSVNLVTRSALDRDGAFGSVEAAYGVYDIAEEESYRASANYGNVWGEEVRFGFHVAADYSEDNRGSDTLRITGWDPEAKPELRLAPDGFIIKGSHYEDFLITRERVGLSSKLELGLGSSHRWFISGSFNRFDDVETLQRTTFDPDNATNDYTGPFTLTEEFAVQLGYDLNDPAVRERVYGLALENRRLFFDEAIALGTIAYDEENRTYLSVDFQGDATKSLQVTTTEDTIATLQVGGEHVLTDRIQLDYRAWYSDAQKDWTEKELQLDTPNIDFNIAIIEGQPLITDNGENATLARTYRLNDDLGEIQKNDFKSTDERLGGEFNLSYDWSSDKLDTKTQVGFAADLREKIFLRDFRRFSEIANPEDPLGQIFLSDPAFDGGDLEDFLPARGIYSFGPKFAVASTIAFIDDPSPLEFVQVDNDLTTSITDAVLLNYEAKEDVYAGYLMQTLRWRKWEFIAGVRFEETQNAFTSNRVVTQREDLPEDVQASLPPSLQFIQPRLWARFFEDFGQRAIVTPVTSERSYSNSLYALHARRRLGDNWNARFSVTQTLARPRYTDLVPREIVGVSGARFDDSVRLPNFELRPLESLNFDASLSYYYETFGLVSVALYYKQLDGPVYEEIRTLNPSDPVAQELTARYFSNPLDAPDWQTSRQVNAGEGDLYGVEVSYERRFTEWPSPLDGLGVAANASFIDSEVELLAEDREGDKVPLFLQSDELANVSLFYEKYGFLAKVSWSYRGEYLDNALLAGDDIKDLENRLGLPRNSLDPWIDDFVRVDVLLEYRPRSWISIFFEGTNVLDEPLETYYGDPSRKRSTRYTGPVYFGGVQVNF